MRLDKVLEYSESNTKAKLERWQINETDWWLRLYLYCAQAKEMVCFQTMTVQRNESGRNNYVRLQQIALKHCGIIEENLTI